MRTTLILPDKLVKEAKRLCGARTKTQAIIWGLEEITRRKRAERLCELRGILPLKVDLRKARGR